MKYQTHNDIGKHKVVPVPLRAHPVLDYALSHMGEWWDSSTHY